MPENTDELYCATVAERRRMVALLERIEPGDWSRASLCAGWRVREVTAHLTMAYRYSGWDVIRGVLGARGSFNRFADRAAQRDSETMTAEQLLRSMADNVEHPWRPPGGGQAGALSHDVIHGLDITEPLGLDGPPVATTRLVLDNAGPRNLKFFGIDLTGHRLVATDTDWQLGDGEPIHLTAKEALMVITGRAALPGTAAR